MNFNPADKISLTFFNILCAFIIGLVYSTFIKVKAPRIYRSLFLIYILFFSAVVAAGLSRSYIFPVVPLLFGSVFLVAVGFALSPIGLKIAQSFSFAGLLGFQAFRLPLELILHHWVNTKTLPETMTWSGQNFDVVTGILALIGIPFFNKSIKWVWFVEIVGVLLLLNVTRVVIMSLPLPFAWKLEVPLQLAFYLPYALIGPLCVGTAIAGHIIVFRKLRGTSSF